jgi:hypothetical protein
LKRIANGRVAKRKTADRDGAIHYQSGIEYALFADAAKSGYSSISTGVPKKTYMELDDRCGNYWLDPF